MCYMYIVPVTLVDYYRADYGSPPTSLYQFYFVFLREVLVGINGLEVSNSTYNDSPYFQMYIEVMHKNLYGQ